MRQITQFSADWQMNATDKNANEYPPSEVSLPFIHSADDIGHITLFKNFRCDSVPEKRLYLEIHGTTGLVSVYSNGQKAGSHSGIQTTFRVLLSEKVSLGDEFGIRLEINPRSRSDGKFIIGRINLLFTGDSCFSPESYGSHGVYPTFTVNENTAKITLRPDVRESSAYDMINAVLKNTDGTILAVKNAKSDCGEFSFDVDASEVYSSARPKIKMLDISLLRDTTLLDSVVFPVGICQDKTEGCAFMRNGREVKLSGASFTDFSSVRKDIGLIMDAGFNCVHFSGLTSKNNFFDLLDSAGLIGWYDLPYSGKKSDFGMLKEMIYRYCGHPSFRFICCSEKADDAYVKKFTETAKSCPGNVMTVLHRNVMTEKPLPKNRPKIIALHIEYGSVGENFEELERRLDTHFGHVNTPLAVFITPPATGGFPLQTPLFAAQWMRRIFEILDARKDVMAVFAGDIKENYDGGELYSGEKLTLYGQLFQTRNARSEYLVIESDGEIKTRHRTTDVTVYSTNPGFKVLVNSKLLSSVSTENPARNVYVLKDIKLPSRNSLIEISAGEQCDNVAVVRGKK